MEYSLIRGVPDFTAQVFRPQRSKYCLCIPVINEGNRIQAELKRAFDAGIDKIVDIIICDGGSTDGSLSEEILESLGVQSLLIKRGPGKQGAQLRMGFWFALNQDYSGILTIDGNNKDSIESVPKFIEKLEEGYDFVQGSRYLQGGEAVNTPLIRHLAVTFIHAPIITLTAKHKFTDTTNAFRGYSRKYLTHASVQPLRDIFVTYELLAYLSVRASQLGMKVTEVPVSRVYPAKGKTPTKISFFKGNGGLLKILFLNLLGRYKPL
ncbi:glycosyltransferase family 2 protein [Flavobacterium sp.]|uniref:glycosyltransferase family 2 protein n=1 Tax=Flavobacterium sp. TaxID=239 RepID=UPI00261DD35E|nr:glycosyltransferase family 2 protein [Flavobacterium sp.]